MRLKEEKRDSNMIRLKCIKRKRSRMRKGRKKIKKKKQTKN